MASLKELIDYCDTRSRRWEVRDFPGSMNGLQMANNGSVSRVGAAVDAGLEPFREAARRGIDFLIVHHGMYWNAPFPLTGVHYEKVKLMMGANIALYSSHLPLDCHPQIGNNVLLSEKADMKVCGTFLNYEGNDIAIIAKPKGDRACLRKRLETLFPRGITAIEYGSSEPERVAVLTGSGQSAVSELKQNNIDTLITGELKQQHFNQAQEEGLNLYCCGHYATETFGVCALAAEVAARFNLEWEFIDTGCPL